MQTCLKITVDTGTDTLSELKYNTMKEQFLPIKFYWVNKGRTKYKG